MKVSNIDWASDCNGNICTEYMQNHLRVNSTYIIRCCVLCGVLHSGTCSYCIARSQIVLHCKTIWIHPLTSVVLIFAHSTGVWFHFNRIVTCICTHFILIDFLLLTYLLCKIVSNPIFWVFWGFSNDSTCSQVFMKTFFYYKIVLF